MKVGDKYIVEIAEVQEYHDENGNVFELGRVKGFKALTLDEVALKKLEPIRHGHWIDNGDVVVCSRCTEFYIKRFNLHRNYCPNCGAKMDGDKE